jgi:hypothetical protein
VTVTRDDDEQGNGWKPSKRFWDVLLAAWVIAGVGAVISQNWWTLAAAVIGIIAGVAQRRYAADRQR